MRNTLAAMLLFLPLLAQAAARIEVVGGTSVDLGKYPTCERRTATFMLRNAGDAPLQIIRVRKSCGCATVAYDKPLIQPAETARVEVVILPDSIAGRYSKSVFVESSDPLNRFLRLNVAGEAVPLVAVQPEALAYLGRIPTSTSATKSFTLIPADPAVLFGVPAVEGSARFSATLSSIAALPSNGLSARVEVVLRPCPVAGEVRAAVLVPILFPSHQPSVKIEVSAKIGGELLVVPSVIALSRSDKSATKELTLQVIGASGLTADQFVLPRHPGVAFSLRPTEDPLRFSVTVACEAAFLKELAGRQVPLVFSAPGCASATVTLGLAPYPTHYIDVTL